MSEPSSSVAVPLWKCDFLPIQGQGSTALNMLTVGAPFKMECQGDIAVQWGTSPALVFPKENFDYSLVILKTQKLAPNYADFIVTGYKAGKFNPDYLRVLTGQTGFETSKPSWNIETVIKDQKTAHPYPPYGPYILALPSWIWLVVILAATALIAAIWAWIRRIRYRRRLKDALDEHATSFSPLAQYHKALRGLRRIAQRPESKDWKSPWLEQLGLSIRVYLMQKFSFLTLKLPPEKIMAHLKRHHKDIYRHASPDLEKLFAEIERFGRHLDSHGLQDFEQLIRMAQAMSEKIEQPKGAQR